MDLPGKDRDRVAEACYRGWCRVHTSLGPWGTLADWKKENFEFMADEVLKEMEGNVCSDTHSDGIKTTVLNSAKRRI